MRVIVLRSVALWIGLLLVTVGCGGATASSPDAGAGPLATCSGNCSPAQIAASCAETCDKIADAGCSPAGGGSNCPMSCASLPSMAPACTALAEAFLRCAESVQPTCSASGTVQFGACDAAQQAVTACVADSGPPPSGSVTGNNPSGGTCGSVPANVCPSIPRPAGRGPMACSGSGGAGPNGPPTSTTQCQDRTGNTWQATCQGSTCTCTYNGGSTCTCMMAGQGSICNSCCPGTG